jgi:hypothetical protein
MAEMTKCMNCEAETSLGDFCYDCLQEKIKEFKSIWRWATPRNRRCISETAEGERCPYLARADSEYCPTCRTRYDKTIRCTYVLPTGNTCTQYRQKGDIYCHTHRKKVDKQEREQKRERHIELLDKIKAGKLEEITFNDIVELAVYGHIEGNVPIVLSIAKFANEYLCKGESNG